MIEIELKILDIDPEEIRGKLRELGAEKVFGERLYKRIGFLDRNGYLSSKNGWVRLRDEGDKVTLAYKEDSKDAIDGVKEVSFNVSSFDDAREFLKIIGLNEINYQENTREEWVIGEIIFEIDKWPLLDSYLEIEGQSEKEVLDFVQKLGLQDKEKMYGPTGKVYTKKLGININDYPILTFQTSLKQ